MKNILPLFLIGLFLFSCKEIDNPDINELPQEWYLKGYKSSWVPQDKMTPISDTTYYYSLNADGSFVKKIGQYSLTGTFDFEVFEGVNYVSLNYDQESYQLSEEWGSWGLIHYCGQDYEYFTILDSKTVQGNWGSCDGPILIFERK
jgi:hypothetical protein